MIQDIALFKYELAIVAILKNEAPYIKEWLDYHILAGVDHFYLYNNDSEDNLEEVLHPYIVNGIINYSKCPGKCAQMLVYNDALQRHKFSCKYMALIDADEFIYPRENKSIKEIIYEVFSKDSAISGLAMNWRIFGSSGQEKADFSKGVLERFLYRAPDNFAVEGSTGNETVKTIYNPRCVNFFTNPHFAIYFQDKYTANENGDMVELSENVANTVNKIGINHYFTKSKEEFINKVSRGKADLTDSYEVSKFDIYDRNDVYDDGILVYREVRKSLNEERPLQIESLEAINQRRLNSLLTNLSPAMLTRRRDEPTSTMQGGGWLPNTSDEFFVRKLYLFLTCWAVNRDLKLNGLNETDFNYLEELSLKCIYKSLIVGEVEVWQFQLLINELPNLLSCPYPVVEDIKEVVRFSLPKLMNIERMANSWVKYDHLNYILRMLNVNEVK